MILFLSLFLLLNFGNLSVQKFSSFLSLNSQATHFDKKKKKYFFCRTGKGLARSTKAPVCPSSRCFWTPRSRFASRETRRVCTKRPGKESSKVDPFFFELLLKSFIFSVFCGHEGAGLLTSSFASVRGGATLAGTRMSLGLT